MKKILLFLTIVFSLLAEVRTIPNRLILTLSKDTRPLIHNKIGNEDKLSSLPELYRTFHKEGGKKAMFVVRNIPDSKAQEYGLDLLLTLVFPENADMKNIKHTLLNIPYVEKVEEDLIVPLMVVPNDPYCFDDPLSGQWYVFQISAPSAWDITQGDATQVYAGVDSGLWWDHPDIFPDLWVNPGEDINNNGQFDYPSDLNGVDDDGNGFVDDVIGWDFRSDDWDPRPNPAYEGYGHGTHVQGIINAATDNGIGIAGVGWNTKIAGFRAQAGNNSISIIAAIDCIYYAANMGFKGINFSWGGYSTYGPLQDAINYAHGYDVLMTAAAGNDNIQNPLYPANYAYVISVAATDQVDRKTSFSNYGNWIDISSPGIDIWSTIPDTTYDRWAGTSMAAPIVLGAGALVRSYFPSISSDSVELLLRRSADDIDSLNPGYEGLLGDGRVNVFYALNMPLKCFLSVQLDSVQEIGNGNGRPEPGENMRLYLKVSNRLYWRDAGGIEIVLRTQDANLTLTDSVINIASLPDGQTVIPSDYFQVSISGTPRYVDFTASVKSVTPPSMDTVFPLTPILVGFPDILVIDDDGGEEFEGWYLSALDSLGLSYEHFDIAVQGFTPKFTGPVFREAVIWLTGNQTSALNMEQKDSLVNYLTGGGNLFISSKAIANSQDTSLFFSDYLKAGVDSLDISYFVVLGDTGDVVGDGWNLLTGGGDGANNRVGSDIISPLSGSYEVAFYSNSSGTANYGGSAVRYQGANFKTVYFAFPFEAINNQASGRSKREEVMFDVLNWFGMFSVQENAPVSDKPGSLEKIVFNGDNLRLSLKNVGNSAISLSIYNILGQRLFLFKGKPEKETLVFALPWTPGVYFYNFKGSEKITGKILKLK